MQEENWYAAPAAAVGEPFGTDALEHAQFDVSRLASRGARLGAAFVDTVLWMCVSLVPVLIGAFQVGLGTISPDSMGSVFFISLGVLWLALAGINLSLLHKHGQSIGKVVFKVRIVRSDLVTRASLVRIVFLRTVSIVLLGLIPVIGIVTPLIDAMLIFGADRRCMHDHFADTSVINAAHPTRPAGSAPTW